MANLKRIVKYSIPALFLAACSVWSYLHLENDEFQKKRLNSQEQTIAVYEDIFLLNNERITEQDKALEQKEGDALGAKVKLFCLERKYKLNIGLIQNQNELIAAQEAVIANNRKQIGVLEVIVKLQENQLKLEERMKNEPPYRFESVPSLTLYP